MPDNADTYSSIQRDLDRLREMPLAIDGFCGRNHKFKLNDPLDEASIVQFEEAIGISLPDDYRNFIKHVGNGGAGPDYGIEPLGLWCKRPVRQDDNYIGDPTAPFPYTRTDFPGEPAEGEDDDDYFRPLDGAIPIGNHGCGKTWWLVVSGPLAGMIWFDGRASDQGVAPAWSSFFQWYRFWLDYELAKAEGPEAANAFLDSRFGKSESERADG